MYYIYGYLCGTRDLCRSDISDVGRQREHDLFCMCCFDFFFWRRHLEGCQTSVWRNWFASVLWHLILRSSFRMSAALWWASSSNVDREDHHGWGIDCGPIHHRPSVLELPEDLHIYEETFEGPIKKSSQNLRSMSKDLIWIHIMKEEHEALPASIEYHREGVQMVTCIRKPTSIPAHLRHPWSVAPSEVHPASVARCDRQHLDGIERSTHDIHTWQQLSHRSQTISVEHRKWHQARSSQLLVEAWHRSLHPGHQRCIPLRSWRTIEHEDLQHQGKHLQGHLRESGLAAWHLVGLSRPISCQLPGNRGIMQALCSIAVSHAGLMITQSSLITRRL